MNIKGMQDRKNDMGVTGWFCALLEIKRCFLLWLIASERFGSADFAPFELP